MRHHGWKECLCYANLWGVWLGVCSIVLMGRVGHRLPCNQFPRISSFVVWTLYNVTFISLFNLTCESILLVVSGEPYKSLLSLVPDCLLFLILHFSKSHEDYSSKDKATSGRGPLKYIVPHDQTDAHWMLFLRDSIWFRKFDGMVWVWVMHSPKVQSWFFSLSNGHYCKYPLFREPS